MNTNAQLELLSASFDLVLVPGGIKKVKTENRRADAMSWMNPRSISVMKDFNLRVRAPDYLEHLRSIADSMKVEGFLIDRPISAFVASVDNENLVYVVDGHTRLEAALLAIDEGASFTDIPVILLAKSMSMADLTVSAYRGNTGRQHTTYESSLYAVRLQKDKDKKVSEAEIGLRMGHAQSWINSLLLLGHAPEPIRRMVASDEISATEAIAMLRKHGAGALDVIQNVKMAADAAGKAKVTNSQMPGALFAKAVKRSAPHLFQTAKLIQLDPGYRGLTAENRTLLEGLLEELSKHEPVADPETAAA